MTIRAITAPQRRGACPGLSAPMPTGDGLLVRLTPNGAIPLAAMASLCAAARQHGNGVMEITARGSIQVRGLTSASAPRFAVAIAALGIAADHGPAVLTGALAGVDPEQVLDAGVVAARLRRTLSGTSLAASLAPKISVVIDGGGSLGLHDVTADIRLAAAPAHDGAVFRVGAGGDAAQAVQLGVIAPDDGVEAAMRMLDVMAQRGRNARARDILATHGAAPFQAALRGIVTDHAATAKPRDRAEAIGPHVLRDGLRAYGVGLAFSHSDASALAGLTDAAGAAGATGVRAAPSRVLMVLGLPERTVAAFAAIARRLGFIVDATDPRRHVIACAGAPICAAAHLAARGIAPAMAQMLPPRVDRAFTIHISGCAKGCAHPAPAALTVVGTPGGCALIADGATCDVPYALVAANALPAAVADFIREHGARHVRGFDVSA